jgi:transposase
MTDGGGTPVSPQLPRSKPAVRMKMPSPHLRRIVVAILWRHQNGAEPRALPDEFGPCWTAAQGFLRSETLSSSR